MLTNPGTPSPKQSPGFTRIDLAAALVIAVALVVLQLARAGNATTTSAAAICLANFQGLIRAWQLYAHDNHGQLVPSYVGSLPPIDGNSIPWAQGWMDWSIAPDNTNTAFLVDPQYAKLGPYLNDNATLFKCPNDRYLSPTQIARGWSHRVRSVTANVGVGRYATPSFPIPGPFDPIYKDIRTTADFLFPGPNETWVHIEEHPDSINDTMFNNPGSTRWTDFPAAYHNGGATLSFADGHADIHHWRDSLRPQRLPKDPFISTRPPSPGDLDLHWLSYRGGRVSKLSY